MKKAWKILSAMLITAALAAGFIIPAAAAPFTYTAVNGGTTTFKKYFVVEEDTEFPLVEFEYTIAPGTRIPADTTNNKMEVLAGVTGATIGKAVLTSAPLANEVFTSVQSGDSSLTLAAGEKYRKTTVTVDFSNCSFTEPGVYRYVVTETQHSNTSIACDTDPYYIDVYVKDTNGTLSVDSYVMHSEEEAPDTNATSGTADVSTAGDPVDDKVDGITNRYPTTALSFAKVVTGNQGSRDKYFEFTVDISGLPGGAVLTVDLTNADGTSGTNAATIDENQGKTNVTSLTADASGAINQKFYLQNGQYIKIFGLTENSEYTVSENEEDYTSVDAHTTAITVAGQNFSDAVSGTVGTTDIYTGFTNTRDGIIPTGVLMSVAPVVIVGLIVVGGIVFFAVRGAKRKASEAAEEDA